MKTLLTLAFACAFLSNAAMAQTSENKSNAPVAPPAVGELRPAPVPQPAESQKIEIHPQEADKQPAKEAAK